MLSYSWEYEKIKKMLPFVLALVAVALTNAADVPTQIHIAFAGKDDQGNPNSMAVSWNTKSSTSTSMVKYGVQPGVYTETASGFGSAYYETFNHHVVLGALQPATTYYYVVGDDAAGWSTEFNFKSAIPASQLRGNFSFFVFGDLGVVNGDPTTDFLNNNRDNAALVWHGGDVSYADDAFLHKDCVFKFCYEDTIDTYLGRVQPFASHIPYMVTPGNHEAGK